MNNFVRLDSPEAKKALEDLKTSSPEEEIIAEETIAEIPAEEIIEADKREAALKAKRSAAAKKAARTRALNKAKLGGDGDAKAKRDKKREALRAKKAKAHAKKHGLKYTADEAEALRLTNERESNLVIATKSTNDLNVMINKLDPIARKVAFKAVANNLIFSSCNISKKLFDIESGYTRAKLEAENDPFDLYTIYNKARSIDDYERPLIEDDNMSWNNPEALQAQINWQMETYTYLANNLLGLCKDKYGRAMELPAVLEFLIKNAGRPRHPIPDEMKEHMARTSGITVEEFENFLKLRVQHERTQWNAAKIHIIHSLVCFKARNRINQADPIQKLNLACKIVEKIRKEHSTQMTYMIKFGKFDLLGNLPIFIDNAKRVAKWAYRYEKTIRSEIDEAISKGRFVDNPDDAMTRSV